MQLNRDELIDNRLLANVAMTVASLDPNTGGPARSVPCLGEAIQKVGPQVHLFVNNKEAETWQGNRNGVPAFLSIKSINKLDATVKQSKSRTTLIHSHGIWLPFNHYVSVIAQRYNVPLVISPRGMLEPWARNYRSWKKMLAWYLYQRRDLKAASVFHATSEQEAKNLQLLGLHIPIAIIPNAVDIPALSSKDGNKRKNIKTALFLSRIHPKKGLIDLVRAWARIRPAGWQVVIAGPDEKGHQGEVEQEIQRHELTDTFNFIGPVNDLDKWTLYTSADLFILPSYSENFGVVVAEALASRLPVITTKGAPWADLEEHNCGWWIDIGVEPLVEALKKAMNLSTEERLTMGQNGRRLVEQDYSWDKIGKKMLSVYDWVLGGGAAPDCVIIDS